MVKTSTQIKTDIIVVGAGVVGLVTSLLLADKGFDVCLIEKNQPSDKIPKKIEDGHTTALMNASINVLKRTNAWEKVEGFTEPLKVLRVFDPEKEGQQVFDFTAKEIGQQSFGSNIPQSILRPVLLERVKKVKSITYMPKTIITGITNNDFDVSTALEDGRNISAKLLIACDGRSSTCRDLLDVEIEKKDYDQTALTFAIKHSLEHQNVSTEIYKPGGPLTFVPLPGGKTSSVVWVNETGQAQELLRLKKQELEAALQAQSKDILGNVSIETTVGAWPLSTLKAKQFFKGRCVLIGETAHGLSPIGAQGLNLSLRDIDALVHLIHGYAKTGQDIGSGTLLEQFEKQREKDISMRFYGVDLLNQFIKTDRYFSKKIREFGLDIISNILPLKHFLIRKGMRPDVKKSA